MRAKMNSLIQVRVHDTEKQKLAAAAAAAGLSLSEYIRTTALFRVYLDSSEPAWVDGAVTSLRQVEQIQATMHAQIKEFLSSQNSEPSGN